MQKNYLVSADDVAFVLELIAIALGGVAGLLHLVNDFTRVLLGLLGGLGIVEVSLWNGS